MSYSSGGTIEATDYNGLALTNSSNIAYVWGTGSRNYGYGQSTSLISSVSAGTLVSATQWAGLIYTLNRVLGHQGLTQLGGGANINTTAGQTITYFANVAGAVTDSVSNRLNKSANGTTITGSNFTYSLTIADSTAGATGTFTRTVTFPSGDAARYFFNAGGQLNLVLTASNNNATARSGDFVNLFQTWLGGSIIGNTVSTPRTGSGGTLISSSSALGYWGSLNTSNQILANVQSNSATYKYTDDWAYMAVKTSSTAGSNGDNGTTITFTMFWSTAPQTNSNFNDAVNVTVTSRVDIVPPETTFLSNVWGAIGIT